MPYRVDTKVAGGNALPTAYITSVSIKEGGLTKRDENSPNTEKTGRGLTINLDINLKDIVEKNQISTWLFNSEFTKYLSIKIIQSLSPDLSRQLKRGNLKAAKSNKFKRFYKENNLLVQESDTNSSSLENSLQKYSSIVTTTGERIYNIPLNTKFTIPTRNPKHLSYFTYVFLDLQAMAKEYGMPIEYLSLKTARGEMTTEQVITRGEINTVGYLYYLTTNGSLYSGAKHRNNLGQWYTGRRPSETSILLKRTEVLNTKIKDYREVENLSGQDLLLLKAIKTFEKAQKKALNGSLNNITQAQEAYFSDALISQTRVQTADILFHLDIKQLVRDNSAFGGILDVVKSPKVRREIYLLSKIKNLKVFRRRVSPTLVTNKLGSPRNSNIYNASSEITKTIIFSSDKDGFLEMKEDEKAGIREVENIAFSQGVRTFTVSDKTTEDLTDGFYQYGAYVEVEDGTILYLNRSLDKLKNARNLMQKYQNDCLNPKYLDKNGKFRNSLSVKYKNLSNTSMSVSPWTESIAAFISVYSSLVDLTTTSKKLSKKLYSLVNPKSGTSEGVSAFIGMISDLISKLEYILGDKKNTGIDGPYNKKSSGSGNNSRGLLFTEAFFSELYDSNRFRNVGLEYIPSSSKNKIGIKGIVVEDIENRVKRETEIYWKNSNLTQVSLELAKEYSTRPAFNQTISSIFDLNDNQYKFFTPAKISCGGITIDRMNMGTNLWSPIHYNAVMGAVLALNTGQYNLTKTLSYKSNTADSQISETTTNSIYDSAALNLLSQANIIISNLDSEQVEEDTNSTIEVNNIFGEQPVGSNSPINVTTEAANTEDSIVNNKAEKSTSINSSARVVANVLISQDSTTGKTNKKNKRKSGQNLSSNNIPKQSNYDFESKDCIIQKDSRKVEKIIEATPNQIRSLLFSDSSLVRNDFLNTEQDFFLTSETSQMMRVNFDMFGMIEVFKGFETNKEGDNIINKPKFVMFKPEILRKAQKEILICRIKPYENLKLKIGINKGLNMPIYDKYFLLTVNDLLMNRNINKKIDNIVRSNRRARARALVERENLRAQEALAAAQEKARQKAEAAAAAAAAAEAAAEAAAAEEAARQAAEAAANQAQAEEEERARLEAICRALENELRLLEEELINKLQYRDMLQDQMDGGNDVSGMLADTIEEIRLLENKIDVKTKEIKICRNETISCKWLEEYLDTLAEDLQDWSRRLILNSSDEKFVNIAQQTIKKLQEKKAYFEAALDNCDPTLEEGYDEEEDIIEELDSTDADDIPDEDYVEPETDPDPDPVDPKTGLVGGDSGVTLEVGQLIEDSTVYKNADTENTSTIAQVVRPRRRKKGKGKNKVVNFDDAEVTETEQAIIEAFEDKQTGGTTSYSAYPTVGGNNDDISGDGSLDPGFGYQY